ncbi:polyphosphate kinase 1 [Idiomarina aminovorans]|uniref:polyphosphate kinase 1 n=1 Tax=Idiomarina aminovorans TaxID=2914829 RepID=UPI0020046547|nr:polyphosphate kinase 1 [Idiomarina sp. ATCH4]MCK7459378.1 polyphosphate kinase 1 [Idiomarina sp. ATCH4]
MKFFNKELSWLSFNERVLQEAADSHVPAIERIHFLGIFSSNMDEFFQVRVADVKRRIFFSQAVEEREHYEHLMEQLQQKVARLQKRFDEVLEEVLETLRGNGISLLNIEQLDDEEKCRLKRFFKDKVQRFIVPIWVNGKGNLANIVREDETYLCVEIVNGDEKHYALLEVPSDQIDRFIQLPTNGRSKQHKILFLDDVLQLNLNVLFQGIIPFEQLRAFSFKTTRDAEYRPSDDIEQSLLERMEEGLKQRIKADPVRLVYDRAMPEEMLDFLSKKLELTQFDSFVAGGRYRNTRDFVKFPHLGKTSLIHKELPSLFHPKFSNFENVFAAIQKNDIALYYPYYRFSHFTEFVRQAAYDPKVTRISMCIYRVAPNSRVIRSLMDAVQNGKHVTVMVELQARFDEEANIEWAKELTDSGVRVSFGIQGLKVHSKLVLVHRNEGNLDRRYAVIGTGNFHEGTAQIYTDFSLFTCQPDICADVESVFHYLEQPYRAHNFHHLMVAPVNMRQRINELIEFEIEQAKAGKPAKLFFKVNNLEDEHLIIQLYRASRAGVKIQGIVRGMCSLRPGVENLSENIEIRSIVDRYLEHARVYVFEHGGKEEVFIASADLMTRNLDHRVEVAAPVYDPDAKADILKIIALQWQDKAKSRLIDAEQTNRYCFEAERKVLKPRALVPSQVAIHRCLKRRERVYESRKKE